MAEKKKFSACHNAAVIERGGKDHCSVCHKECDLADPKEALAAHKADRGHSEEQVLAGGSARAAAAAAPEASDEDESDDEDEDEEDESDEDEDDSEDELPAVNAKMKRADLEKIARDEGASDAEISDCEKNSDLVDLIESRREDGEE